MTKAPLTQNEHLSALLDGEENLAEHILTAEDHKTFERYALIGDVVKTEQQADIYIDIADRVALALENEPVYGDFSGQHQGTHNAVDEKIVNNTNENNVVSINWKKPLGQIAIAASVALVAIIGVQTIPNDQVVNPIPMYQTTPVGGVASPVSYSTEPALANAKQGLRELQQQRIGALVLEHQRQTRIASQVKTTDNQNKPKAKDSN